MSDAWTILGRIATDSEFWGEIKELADNPEEPIPGKRIYDFVWKDDDKKPYGRPFRLSQWEAMEINRMTYICKFSKKTPVERLHYSVPDGTPRLNRKLCTIVGLATIDNDLRDKIAGHFKNPKSLKEVLSTNPPRLKLEDSEIQQLIKLMSSPIWQAMHGFEGVAWIVGLCAMRAYRGSETNLSRVYHHPDTPLIAALLKQENIRNFLRRPLTPESIKEILANLKCDFVERKALDGLDKVKDLVASFQLQREADNAEILAKVANSLADPPPSDTSTATDRGDTEVTPDTAQFDKAER